MALKSCNEIDTAKTLYMFLIDLQKLNPDIPSRKNTEIIKQDKQFQLFLSNVILCTEQGYDENLLKEAAKKEHRLEYKNAYIDLISKVIEDLLIENKVNKMQTFGYTLDRQNGGLNYSDQDNNKNP